MNKGGQLRGSPFTKVKEAQHDCNLQPRAETLNLVLISFCNSFEITVLSKAKYKESEDVCNR